MFFFHPVKKVSNDPSLPDNCVSWLILFLRLHYPFRSVVVVPLEHQAALCLRRRRILDPHARKLHISVSARAIGNRVRMNMETRRLRGTNFARYFPYCVLYLAQESDRALGYDH